MIVGCYSMDLYCDTGHNATGMASMREYQLAQRHQYTGKTEAECKREARKDGWLFRRDGRVFCRVCVKDKRAFDIGEIRK